MRFPKWIPILCLNVLFCIPSSRLFAEIVEDIYAVVNDEIITYSDMKKYETGMINELRSRLKGDELEAEIQKMKKDLINNLIDQKVVISKAKEKKYNVDQYVDVSIEEMKKQNQVNTEQLKQMLAEQGIEWEDFRKYTKEQLMRQQLMRDEIGSKVKIENAEIMSYYKDHKEEFTQPLKFSLNCIYLSPENYVSESFLEEKMKTIDTELSKSPFEDVAKNYSELPNPDNRIFLGNFKPGELDKAIEDVAMTMKKGDVSGWIKTEAGQYKIHMSDRVEPKLLEYKEVRDKIEEDIRDQRMGEKVKEYLDQLRKESFIKIYKTSIES